MNFDYHYGTSLALAKRATFADPRDSCLHHIDVDQLQKNLPSSLITLNDYVDAIDKESIKQKRNALPEHWQGKLDAILNNQTNDFLAFQLLELLHLTPSLHKKSLGELTKMIAVHEIAAFSQREDSRLRLRLKKSIPPSFFPIWDRGLESKIDDDMAKLIRDAYLNLNQHGLEHIGFYLICFSKVHESEFSFTEFLKNEDNIWAPHLRAFRELSLKSSRKKLALSLRSRIHEILDSLAFDERENGDDNGR